LSEWRVARSEWRVARSEWRVARSEWRVARSEWRVASGVRTRAERWLWRSLIFSPLSALHSPLSGRCHSGRIPLRLFFPGISDRVDPGIELAGGDVLGRMRRGDDGRSRTGEEAGKLEDPAAQGHQEHHAQDHEAPVEKAVRFRRRGEPASGDGVRLP